MPDADRAWVREYAVRSVETMQAFADDLALLGTLSEMAARVVGSMRAGGKLLVAGNGGSAADAQHIAGEFVSRLMYDRAPLPAIALTTDTSAMTATANDYGYDHVFARQVMALGRPGDIFLGISTSGRSLSVLRALEVARAQDVLTFGFTGSAGGAMPPLCDLLFRAPSDHTPLIQQVHITAAHIICALVERGMFPRGAT